MFFSTEKENTFFKRLLNRIANNWPLRSHNKYKLIFINKNLSESVYHTLLCSTVVEHLPYKIQYESMIDKNIQNQMENLVLFAGDINLKEKKS